MAAERKHVVSVVVEGREVDGWLDYEISSSMIEPSDSFSMRRPWDPKAWNALPRDARIRVFIDRTQILDGFIDDRAKHTKDNTLEISGRDRAGRLVQESAPAINYNGLEMSEAVRRLVDPWFTTVTLSDARNRSLRMGKGRKMPTGTEPIVVHVPALQGRVHPGQSRWDIIEQIVSQAHLIAWSSADGREFFVGKPNYTQQAQFAIVVGRPGSGTKTTCTDLIYRESNGDRYSLIACVGNGGGTEADFGISVSSRRAVVFDNELNTFDGTGRDFIYPKRLLMPERGYDSNAEASAEAGREQARRDFRRTVVTAPMPLHGQFISTGAPTIFAPNTIARVRDEEFEPPLDDAFLIYACTYHGSREEGETTMLELVPKGTEIVP